VNNPKSYWTSWLAATRPSLTLALPVSGGVQSGLIFHPDGRHLIYPLGSTIVIRDLASSHSQRFLHGHKDRVSCVAMSPSGRYLASGQVTHMGFTVSRSPEAPPQTFESDPSECSRPWRIAPRAAWWGSGRPGRRQEGQVDPWVDGLAAGVPWLEGRGSHVLPTHCWLGSGSVQRLSRCNAPHALPRLSADPLPAARP